MSSNQYNTPKPRSGLVGGPSRQLRPRNEFRGNRGTRDVVNRPFGEGRSNEKGVATVGPPSVKALSHAYPEVYGVIYSLKANFGFIQPLVGEEQVYLSERDFYDQIKVGDKVGYIERRNAKGSNAENIRVLTPQFEKSVVGAQGVITRSPDRHRSGYGLLKVNLKLVSSDVLDKAGIQDSKVIQEVPFKIAEVDVATLPRNHRLEKGDLLEFDISRVYSSEMFLATGIKFLKLRRDAMAAEQMQRMLEAGAVRETGIVSTLIKGEYGFIKGLERRTELYFRLEDVMDGAKTKIQEGSEVDFFAIVESVKGKMSDRAIFLTILPAGSVQLEVCIATSVRARVVVRNTFHSSEETPGIAKLEEPLPPFGKVAAASTTTKATTPESVGKGGKAAGGKSGDKGRKSDDSINIAGGGGGSSATPARTSDASDTEAVALASEMLEEIQLWQRCMPEELSLRVGDVIIIDVHYYRPDKLYFARSVRVHSFRKIARETGKIISVKEHGFGFIHSPQRSIDLYFRSTQVVGLNGDIIADSDLKSDQPVSFDVVIEETSAKSFKLRAFRIKLEPRLTKADRAEQAGLARGGGGGEGSDGFAEFLSTLTPASAAIAQGAMNRLVREGTCVLVKRSLFGVVVKNTSRKDSPGMIKVFPQYVEEINDVLADQLGIVPAAGAGVGGRRKTPVYYDPEMVEAMTEFVELKEMKQVALYGLPNNMMKQYYTLIEDKFPGLIYEASLIDPSDASMGKALKISKVNSDAEYNQWLSKHGKLSAKQQQEQGQEPQEVESGGKMDTTAEGNSDGSDSPDAVLVAGKTTTVSTTAVAVAAAASVAQQEVIPYYKDDYITEDFGPLANDLKVSFDLFWDKGKQKKVAKFVCQTDEEVSDAQGEQRGIIDVIFEKGGKFGFIRSIPTDEKLFWHVSSATIVAQASLSANSIDSSANNVLMDLQLGSEVSFWVRRRGGLRCAVNIAILPASRSLFREVNLISRMTAPTPVGNEQSEEMKVEKEEVCTAIVVAPDQVVPVDFSHCPSFYQKYIDLRVLRNVAAVSAIASVAGSSSQASLSLLVNGSISTSSNELVANNGARALALSTPSKADVQWTRGSAIGTAGDSGKASAPTTASTTASTTTATAAVASEGERGAETETGDAKEEALINAAGVTPSPSSEQTTTPPSLPPTPLSATAATATAIAPPVPANSSSSEKEKEKETEREEKQVEEFNVEYKAKYFPLLFRTPIPIGPCADAALSAAVCHGTTTSSISTTSTATAATTTTTGASAGAVVPISAYCVNGYVPAVGDYVNCRLVVNWGQQRTPLRATKVEKVLEAVTAAGAATAAVCAVKKKGKISRIKFRIKPAVVDAARALYQDQQQQVEEKKKTGAAAMGSFSIVSTAVTSTVGSAVMSATPTPAVEMMDYSAVSGIDLLEIQPEQEERTKEQRLAALQNYTGAQEAVLAANAAAAIAAAGGTGAVGGDGLTVQQQVMQQQANSTSAAEVVVAANSALALAAATVSSDRRIQEQQASSPLFYYCDMRELRMADESSRDLPQVGDTVEFWALPHAFGAVALGSVLAPKSRISGINFKRPTGVSLEAKPANANQIIMAQGPPNDSAKGFAEGWRSGAKMPNAGSVSALPWGPRLLAHFLTAAAAAEPALQNVPTNTAAAANTGDGVASSLPPPPSVLPSAPPSVPDA